MKTPVEGASTDAETNRQIIKNKTFDEAIKHIAKIIYTVGAEKNALLCINEKIVGGKNVITNIPFGDVAADLKKYNLYKQAASCDGGVSCPKTILDLKKISLTIIGLDKETGDICLLAFALMQGMISCEDAKKINKLITCFL
jgi:hypothetical protein